MVILRLICMDNRWQLAPFDQYSSWPIANEAFLMIIRRVATTTPTRGRRPDVDYDDGWLQSDRAWRVDVGSPRRRDLERPWDRWTFVWWRAGSHGVDSDVELLDTFCSPTYPRCLIRQGSPAPRAPRGTPVTRDVTALRIYPNSPRVDILRSASAQSPVQLISARFRAAGAATINHLRFARSWWGRWRRRHIVDTIMNSRNLYCLHASCHCYTRSADDKLLPILAPDRMPYLYFVSYLRWYN